ncbi:MAG: TraI domain-containing protein [Oleiphilaceae bacterium]|nr:TraI domain-containing protein [Oleiphilaceae bacterium]
MILSKLQATLPCNTFQDVFRLTGRLMRIDPHGQPYLRMRLSNVETDIVAIADPEQLTLPESVPFLGLVSVSGVIRNLDGEVVCEITQMDTVSEQAFWNLPALHTCPRLYCPRPDSLDLLVRTIRSLESPELARFVRLVLEQTDRLQKFITIPASYRYHHSFKGGLLVHSVEVARNVVHMIRMNEPEARRELKELGFVAGLFHDIGKILTHDEQGRLTEVGKLIEHDALTLELCSEGLSYLDSTAPRLAQHLRHAWTCGSPGARYGKKAVTTVAKYVRDADGQSAMSENQRMTSRGHIHKGFGRVGSSAYWMPDLG